MYAFVMFGLVLATDKKLTITDDSHYHYVSITSISIVCFIINKQEQICILMEIINIQNAIKQNTSMYYNFMVRYVYV